VGIRDSRTIEIFALFLEVQRRYQKERSKCWTWR